MKKAFKIVCGIIAILLVSAVVALSVLFVGVNAQVTDMNKKVKELTEASDENYVDVHDIYDDKAVVAAYKSGERSKLSKTDEFVLDFATKIINNNIKNKKTDYQKEKALYDWLFKYVAYDENSMAAVSYDENLDNYTPYGVFKNKTSICVGNATTIKLFFDMLGIDNKLIHITENCEHTWNMVKLDGDWYHLDLTFDMGSSAPQYTYFNVPDTVIANNGYSYDFDKFPTASAVKYCYSYNHATRIKDVYQIPDMISKAIKDGKSTFYLVYDNKVDTENAKCEEESEGISTLYFQALNYISENCMPSNYSISMNEQVFDEKHVVCEVDITDSEQGISNSIDNQKLASAANDSFAELY